MEAVKRYEFRLIIETDDPEVVKDWLHDYIGEPEFVEYRPDCENRLVDVTYEEIKE